MSSEARYRLLYEDYESKHYFRFSYSKFSVATLCFPFFSFIFCVVYSLLFNFERVTSTHCNAYNFLPSISAAIGKFSPQNEVWKYSILVHAIPRFFMATSYLQYNREVLRRSVLVVLYITALLNIIENIGLILLSVYSSSENYSVHEKAFITFIITSEIYMILTVILHAKYREQSKNHSEIRSLRWKKRLAVLNISCIAAATYFFIRHNNGCENYIYTYFAISEYIVVLTNMAFHMTANMDFRDRDMIFTRHGVYLSQR